MCVLLGKDNSDSVLLIQMFSDSSCLPGLPSSTFQCSVTNTLHVQFDIEGSPLRMELEQPWAVGWWVLIILKITLLSSAVAIKDVFSVFSPRFILSHIPKRLLFFKGLNFILRNPVCWLKLEIQSHRCFLIFFFFFLNLGSKQGWIACTSFVSTI